jgi:hypothetical protein
MPAGGRNGYVASYVGAVTPIAASIVALVPLAIYTRENSAQLELGALFFVFLGILVLIAGVVLVPFGIYLALTKRGYAEAGRTARAVVVVALLMFGSGVVGELLAEAVVAGNMPEDVASALFVFGLLVAPFLARWYVVRFPKTKRQEPQADDVTALGG